VWQFAADASHELRTPRPCAPSAAHGGHPMLKSAAGVGTSVQVWIPFQPPAPPQPPGVAYS